MKKYNKVTIANNFSKAAANYDNFSDVQKLAAHKLFIITSQFIKDNSTILDLGSGTSAIAKEFVKSQILLQKEIKFIEVDLSQQMLKNWQDKNYYNILSVKSDIEKLPFRNSAIDLILSSFALQWIFDFNKIFADFARILKKDAILSFCLPNHLSLEELKLQSINSGCNFNFNILPKSDEIKKFLEINSFSKQHYFSENVTIEFESPLQALRAIKKIGANYFSEKNFVSKKQLQKFNDFSDDKFKVSWNISYFVFKKN